MKSLRFQATVSGDGFGYVYVMSYPGSSKVKIGHALSPTIRASDIGGTLAPEQPSIEALFWCAERREDVERAAHRLEKSNRRNGEWFEISVEQALVTIQSAADSQKIEIQFVYDRLDYSERLREEMDAQDAAEKEAIVLAESRENGQNLLGQLVQHYRKR